MAKISKNDEVSVKGTKKTQNKNTGTKKKLAKKTAIKTERKKKPAEKRKGTRKNKKKPALQKIDLDNVDEDELLNDGDEIIPSEDDGGSDDERKHQKLLEAISGLGGKKRKLAERSEATIQISEFSVDAKGEGDKINLSDLIQTIVQTPAVSAETKSHLKKLKLKDKTVDSPLSKPETERIQRNVAFQKTSDEVSRWQSIVKQNQKAAQLVFPLNQEAPGPKPIEQVVCGWKAKTPLEQEVFRLLSINKQPINDPMLTPMEEESLKAMSLEEAKIRRAELQKARALQSYYEAKARRERSIKSKKYHKVQNKAKRKDFVKKFDEMVKSDPAGALEELQKLEVGRMKERMSLKHQNSGKWAKSKAIMAKYDDGARKAMQQQLEVNKDLTQKLATTLAHDEDGDDDDDGDASDPDMLPDFVNDAEPGSDPANPWMRGKLSKDAAAGDSTGPNAQETAGAVIVLDDDEEEEEGPEETEEERLLRGFEERRQQRQAQEAEPAPIGDMEVTTTTEENKAEADEKPEADEAAASPDGDDDDDDDDEEDGDDELSKFTNLFQELKDGRMEAEACEPDPTPLQQAMFRIQNLKDMDLLDQEEEEPAEPVAVHLTAEQESKRGDNKNKRKRGIDLNQVLTKEAKVIQVPLTPTTVEGAEEAALGEEEQRDVIKEAFAGDDVVSDFRKDKRREVEVGKPKLVDLTLPGWGEWGGQGLQPSRNKRRRFQLKPKAPAAPRKDGGLAGVIISERRDSAVSVHQVGALPHPFMLPEQFEVTMRAPVGATWNTRRTVKKITMPKIVTKIGAIIEPMSRDELIKRDRKREEEGEGEGGPAGTPQKGKAPQKRAAPRRKGPQKRHKK